ncbi:MAG: hypothetical protein ACREB3_08740 [Burkholderiales bacterium]
MSTIIDGVLITLDDGTWLAGRAGAPIASGLTPRPLLLVGGPGGPSRSFVTALGLQDIDIEAAKF